MKWSICHRKRRRKLFGRQLPKADIERLILLNRFAAGTDRSNPRREEIYALKDRLLTVFGKPAGYALQHWTSDAYDRDYDVMVRNACHHYHVLARVRIGRRTLHQPTAQFLFRNESSDYYRKSEDFDRWVGTCIEQIEGKKRITKNIPSTESADIAFARLRRRYRRFLPEHLVAGPRIETRTVSGYVHWNEPVQNRPTVRRRYDRHDAREFVPSPKASCHWCHNLRPVASRIDRHDFCEECLPKIQFGAAAGGEAVAR